MRRGPGKHQKSPRKQTWQKNAHDGKAHTWGTFGSRDLHVGQRPNEREGRKTEYRRATSKLDSSLMRLLYDCRANMNVEENAAKSDKKVESFS